MYFDVVSSICIDDCSQMCIQTISYAVMSNVSFVETKCMNECKPWPGKS